MIKIGGRPGIPFRVTLTKAEQAAARHQQALARAEPPRRASGHATRRDADGPEG